MNPSYPAANSLCRPGAQVRLALKAGGVVFAEYLGRTPDRRVRVMPWGSLHEVVLAESDLESAVVACVTHARFRRIRAAQSKTFDGGRSRD